MNPNAQGVSRRKSRKTAPLPSQEKTPARPAELSRCALVSTTESTGVPSSSRVSCTAVAVLAVRSSIRCDAPTGAIGRVDAR